MTTEQQKIQDLLDTGTPENVKLAFLLMRTTGIVVDLPSKKDLADWIAYSTGADETNRSLLKILIDEEPLPLAKAQRVFQSMIDCGYFSIELSKRKKGNDFPAFAKWLKWIIELTISGTGKVLLQLPDYFSSLNTLKNLSLSGNIQIEAHSLASIAPYIDNLNLSYNKTISRFPLQGQAWAKLTKIYLESGNTPILDLDLMPALETLSLSYTLGNQFTLEATQPAIHLTEIEISGGNFTDLGNEIWNMLPNLNRLSVAYIGGYKLKALPESIGALKKLKEFCATDNHIQSLPDSIGNLVLLEELNVNNNKITQLPDSIGNLKNLQRACLYQNKLKTLPASFGQLKQLQNLDLSYNAFSELPACVTELTALEELDLDENPLKSIPENIGDMPNLREIIISEQAANRKNIARVLDNLPERISVVRNE